MGLFSKHEEGEYNRSYSIPSVCKDEKAHYDTSDHTRNTETKSKSEARNKPKSQPQSEPQPQPKPQPKQQPQSKQQSKPQPQLEPQSEPQSQSATSAHPPQPNAPLGILNGKAKGKIGCFTVLLIFFFVRQCTRAVYHSSDRSEDDIEVVYDTARYNTYGEEEYAEVDSVECEEVECEDIIECEEPIECEEVDLEAENEVK